MTIQPIIQTKALTKTYSMGTQKTATEVHALRGVSLKVEVGEFVALMGTSGSGKSTLLQLLGCLDKPTSGDYHLDGWNVSALSADQRAKVRNRRIGFVFQTFNLLPRLTALNNAALPLLYRGSISEKQARIRAAEILSAVGLQGRLHHLPTELSGGQQQRVAIARALVANPAIILADEPTGNLDSATGDEILRLLVALHHSGRTIIMVTHDPAVAAQAGRIIHMRDGIFIKEEVSRVAV